MGRYVPRGRLNDIFIHLDDVLWRARTENKSRVVIPPRPSCTGLYYGPSVSGEGTNGQTLYHFRARNSTKTRPPVDFETIRATE